MKKGQLQTLEPILILIIIAIIIGVALLFFVRVSGNQFQQDVSRAEEREMLAVMKRISGLPELSCSKLETESTYCIDKHKAEAFSKMMLSEQNRTFYNPVFGSSLVTLSWLDLNTGPDGLVLYDGLANLSKSKTSTSYFTIYDPLNDERKFAMILVVREVT